ncbi:hypothetical protein HCH_06804 [Hahella chejuensis KCTC 2396]|uniref:Zinc ribbon domain-containing protein n=1 Tax=Hahella chejuensis (strain KCTC 2396) TaxID=349521 RepID=Q2S7E6_HAHCH|nr:hypothetical protein [Hahella chejuensis]ABC33428.1 hypothetical protein HCH_06804 [Hahella chejuensis KCTC 2396]
MKCPKCGFEQRDSNVDCESCGIVFAKYFKYHPPSQANEKPPPGQELEQDVEDIEETVSWRDILLYPGDASPDPISLGGRALLLAGLAIWGVWLMTSSIASNAAGESFLHLINLPFHEAGHVIFRPFGQFIASLGGSLGQLIMPAICFGVLLFKHHNTFGAAVCAWWFGENFLDLAPYINDARAGQLPLLGGNFGHSSPYGFHDWEYLLTETGLLRFDHGIAQGAHLLGSAIMVAAVIWGGVLLYSQFKLMQEQG